MKDGYIVWVYNDFGPWDKYEREDLEGCLNVILLSEGCQYKVTKEVSVKLVKTLEL